MRMKNRERKWYVVFATLLLAGSTEAMAQGPVSAGSAPPPATLMTSTKSNPKRINGVKPVELWRAVEDAFRRTGVTPTETDRIRYRLVYQANPAGNKIGDMKIEKAFDCGGDKKSPVVKTATVAVLFAVELVDAGDATELTTIVQGETVPTDPSVQPVTCKSTGALEKKFAGNLSTSAVKSTFVTTVTGKRGG